MAEESITLISKEYAGGVFQSKLTEANQGDNIKITREGDNLKISAEVPAPGQTTITTSDERVVVNKTETGYDLALNGSFIERGEYTELENTVDGHTTSIAALDNDVNTVKTNVDTLNGSVASLEQSVGNNTQAITTLEQEVAKKQDKLTAGENITITEDNVINASGGGSGELKAKVWVCHMTDVNPTCRFDYLDEYPQTGIDSYRVYTDQKAIIKFTEEKSIAEVNEWLMFEAKLTDNGAAGYIIANDYDKFTQHAPFAVCPWPEDKPWPGAN